VSEGTIADPGTVWTLLRRARTAVGTCVVWPDYERVRA
jgi:hypothetical protein